MPGRGGRGLSGGWAGVGQGSPSASFESASAVFESRARRQMQDCAGFRTGPLIWAPPCCRRAPKIGYTPHATVLFDDSVVQILVGGALSKLA